MENSGIQIDNFITSDIKCLQSITKLPEWIVEYAWVHKMMDTLEGLGSSLWISDDLQTLSLAEPWRLRVAAAEALAIVRTRDVRRFERVMEIMEATYTLLPTLVSAIKHMKIIFGLKTMVIMWMLREDQGILDTVTKTIHFFPSKLPQYQDLSSSREMFLMRKNQQDFKTLAQTLAMDKAVREAYMKDRMEKQYGECYAQKLEDRLTHYLQQLEALLPRDTYIDRLLKREHPVANEEELLIKLITCDVMSKAETLKRLLHCMAASASTCHPSTPARKDGPEHYVPGSGSGYSEVVLEADGGETDEEVRPRNGRKRVREPTQDFSKESPLLLEDEEEEEDASEGEEESQREKGEEEERVAHDGGGAELDRDDCAWQEGQAREEELDAEGEEGKTNKFESDEEGVKDTKAVEDDEEDGTEEVAKKKRKSCAVSPETVSPLQLCTRHQKWVRTILIGCSGECSEEPHAPKSASSPGSPASSSHPSSRDLTPSLSPFQWPLLMLHRISPPTHAPVPSQARPRDPSSTAAAEERVFGSASQTPSLSPPEIPLRPKTVVPTDTPTARTGCGVILPLVRVVEDGEMPSTSSYRQPSRPWTRSWASRYRPSPQKMTPPPPSTPESRTSSVTSGDPPIVPPGQMSVPQAVMTFTGKPLALSQTSTSVPGEQCTTCLSNVTSPQASSSVPGQVSSCPFQIDSIQRTHVQPTVPRPSTTRTKELLPGPVALASPPSPLATEPGRSEDWSQTGDVTGPRCPPSSPHLTRLRLSMESQALLLQSKLLQPYVVLAKMTPREWSRARQRKSTKVARSEEEGSEDENNNDGDLEEEEEDEEEEEEHSAFSNFDVNALYSGDESSYCVEDSDSEYIPHTKTI